MKEISKTYYSVTCTLDLQILFKSVKRSLETWEHKSETHNVQVYSIIKSSLVGIWGKSLPCR